MLQQVRCLITKSFNWLEKKICQKLIKMIHASSHNNNGSRSMEHTRLQIN